MEVGEALGATSAMPTYKDKVIKSVTYYVPSPLPLDPKDIGTYVRNELIRLGDVIFNQATFRLERIHVEPVKPRGGDVRYADGSDWDPGDGEGIYLFKEGAEGETPAWELLAGGGGFELTTKGDLLGFDAGTDEEGRVVVGDNHEVLVADNASDFGFGWNKVQTDSIADHAVGADQLSDMSGVEPDEYEAATITVDKQGRITAASSTTLKENLGDLNDVDTSGASDNNILKYDSAVTPPWTTVAIPGGVSNLVDLDDVEASGIEEKNILSYNDSGEFVPIKGPPFKWNTI